MEHLDNRTLLKIIVDKRIAADRLSHAVHLISRDLSLVEGANEAYEATRAAATAAAIEANQAERILFKRFFMYEKEAH